MAPVDPQVAFRERLTKRDASPLWDVLHALVTPRPTPQAKAAGWRYDALRPMLLEAGALVTAAEAERRVLILENPALARSHRATDTLYAGLQLVLPGEIAPVHRHTQSALRFVLESDGAWTGVDGTRVAMGVFDLVLTPNWRWHEHGNDGGGPAIWLDGLDIPIVSSFAGSFAEQTGNNTPMRSAPRDGVTHGAMFRPVSHPAPEDGAAFFHYPYAQWRAALSQMAAGAADPHLGHLLEFLNPATGGPVMATLSAFARLVPQRTRTRPWRQCASAVVVGVEGAGTIVVDGQAFPVGPRDVVAVPTWSEVTVESGAADLVTFVYSDRAAMEKLGLWREERT